MKFRIWDEEYKFFIFVGNLKEFASEVMRTGNKNFYGNTLYNGEKSQFQQFTGLKDKNGREIYEGDILRWVYPKEGNNLVTVRWTKEDEDSHPGFVISTSYRHYGPSEVIGNIFENPELISS